jgi:thiol-disulfide isomerase/thioredoxin
VARKGHCFVFALAAWIAICVSVSEISSAELTIADPDGGSIRWSSWLEDHGPAAVVLWASWIPDAEATLNEIEAISRVARSKDLEMVLVSVQESPDEARTMLETAGAPWLNDRYGGLLKQFRVVKIPALVIVAKDGRVVARLDATANALREWKSE